VRRSIEEEKEERMTEEETKRRRKNAETAQILRHRLRLGHHRALWRFGGFEYSFQITKLTGRSRVSRRRLITLILSAGCLVMSLYFPVQEKGDSGGGGGGEKMVVYSSIDDVRYKPTCPPEERVHPAFNGSRLLALADDINLTFGVELTILEDESSVTCCNQSLSLRDLKMLQKGRSWYQSLGFKPLARMLPEESIDSDELARLEREAEENSHEQTELVQRIIKQLQPPPIGYPNVGAAAMTWHDAANFLLSLEPSIETCGALHSLLQTFEEFKRSTLTAKEQRIMRPLHMIKFYKHLLL